MHWQGYFIDLFQLYHIIVVLCLARAADLAFVTRYERKIFCEMAKKAFVKIRGSVLLCSCALCTFRTEKAENV